MSVVLQSIDIATMSEGTALAIMGLFGLLLWASVQFRNPAAMVMWGLSVLVLLMTSVYGLRAEMLWLSMIGTTILVVVGATARIMR